MKSQLGRQLGKRAPRIDKRTLQFRDYITRPIAAAKTTPLPYPPPKEDRLSRVKSWPMYANDRIGDCALAYAGHQIQMWESFTRPGTPPPTTEQIIAAYSAITGYVPGDPSTDNGTVLLDMLNYWRKYGIAGRKILAFAKLTQGDLEESRWSVEYFGGTCLGVALPVTAQTQNAWTVVDMTGDGQPGSWGGHCIPSGAFDYSVPGEIRNTVVTWGAEMPMSNNFYKAYNDESYAVFSEDWLDSKGRDPDGFNLSQLLADLKEVTR